MLHIIRYVHNLCSSKLRTKTNTPARKSPTDSNCAFGSVNSPEVLSKVGLEVIKLGLSPYGFGKKNRA